MGQNVEWDKLSNRNTVTSNETKCRMLKCRMGQNVEWYKMSNGTKCRTIIRFYIINLEKMGRMEKMSENIWICPCPRPRPCVPVRVHLPMSRSTCPCVPVRVPLGHGHGTGTQGHVDMGRFLPLNFREFIIHVYSTVISKRFFFSSNNDIILNIHISLTFSTFFKTIFSTLLYI
jgi:hypothetical protein